MNLLKSIPGPVLVFMGAFCLSFGGLIVKSFDDANLWQILFWRQIFFAIKPDINPRETPRQCRAQLSARPMVNYGGTNLVGR